MLLHYTTTPFKPVVEIAVAMAALAVQDTVMSDSYSSGCSFLQEVAVLEVDVVVLMIDRSIDLLLP